MDEKQTKFRKGQKITATISSATDEGLAVYISNTKKEILLPKEEINCESYDKAVYAAKVGEEIEVVIVEVMPRVVVSEKAIQKLRKKKHFLTKLKKAKSSPLFATVTTRVA